MSDEAPFKHLIIRASAGSVKTYRLSERYLKLLLAGAPVDSILATTFTRKAAGEIQSRILARLGKGGATHEGARALSKELVGDPDAISWETLRDLTVSVARSINRLRVCTLDSFFIQLAQGYAFEIGLQPGWSIIEESENNALLRSALVAAFRQTDGKRAHALAKLLFKGETKRSIEAQIYDLALDAVGVYNDSKKVCWFRLSDDIVPEASAQECVDALIHAETPQTKSGPSASCVTLRDKLLEYVEKENWKDILASAPIKKILDSLKEEDEDVEISYYRVRLEGSFRNALKNLAILAASNVKKRYMEELASLWYLLDAVSFYFNRYKGNSGAYRFDDLALKLASMGMEGRDEETDYRLDVKTRHLLLDEFQDASYKQWSILRPFAKNIVSVDPESLDSDDPEYVKKLATFFCVGDVKQAIYGWRGGIAEIFEAIETELKNVKTDPSSKNWRSCPVVINAVNEVFDPDNFKKNPAFPKPEMAESPEDEMIADATRSAVCKWAGQFEEHQWAEKNEKLDGFWSIETAPIYSDERTLAQNAWLPIAEPDDEGGRVVEFPQSAPDDAIERVEFDPEEGDVSKEDPQKKSPSALQKALNIAYAARRIKELHEKYPRASIGVLARSNRYLANILRCLKKLGVDASEEGGATIVDTAAVGALLAVVRLAAHPEDSVDAFCLANIAPIAEKLGLPFAGGASGSVSATTCRRVSSILREKIETNGLGAFLSGLRDLLAPLCERERERERLDQFVEFAISYEARRPQATLDEFLQEVQEYKAQAPSDSCVRVMTIHASKGLEFDIVVLPELEQHRAISDISKNRFIAGRESPVSEIDCVLKNLAKDERSFLIPAEYQKYFSNAIERQVQEAFCLLYVAITRPKRALYAIIPPFGTPIIKKELGEKEAKSRETGSKKLTFAEILRLGLPSKAPLDQTSSLYENPQRLYAKGSVDWGRDLQAPILDEETVQVIPPVRAPEGAQTVLFKRSARNRLLYRRKTPTDAHKEDARIWTPPGRFVRGKCLHACFELTEWLDRNDAPADDRLMRRILPEARYDRRRAAGEIKEFRKLCATQYVRRLLAYESYFDPQTAPAPFAKATELSAPRLELLRERPFTLETKRGLSDEPETGELLRGVIDRLVLLYDADEVVAADVVDFKTDEKFPDDSRLDEYRKQLKAYETVVKKQYGLPPSAISLRLAFVTLEREVDVKRLADA